MATNAATDEKQTVTADDLAELKYGKDGVEGSKETDETDETTKGKETEEAGEASETNSDEEQTDETEETAETESDEESAEFVKELPGIKGDTLEEYTRNLEKAYNASTSEAMRLKGLNDAKVEERVGDDSDVDISNPIQLYAKQKMDEEIQSAFTDFSKQFPQVTDPSEYNKFTVEVSTLSNTILQSQKRLASPKELYEKAAVILGWETEKVTSKDRLNAAVKSTAAVSRTTSSPGKPASKSKVTDQMIAINRMMYPNKSDEQIRKELEPYVK